MKRKTSSIGGQLRKDLRVRPMYLENLLSLVDMGREAGFTLTYFDKDCEFDDLDDVREHLGSTLEYFGLRFQLEESKYRDVIVIFDCPRAAVIADNTPHMLALQAHIVEYLRRFPMSIYSKVAIFIPLLVALSVGAFMVLNWLLKANALNNASISIIALAYLGSFALEYIERRRNRIYLERRHAVSNFYQRNEKIILILVSAVLGALITTLKDQLFPK